MAMNLCKVELRLDASFRDLLLILLVAGMVLAACSGHRVGTPRTLPTPELSNRQINAPVKVFLKNGDIVLFPNGAAFYEESVAGEGRILHPSGKITELAYGRFLHSEIVGTTLYEFQMSPEGKISTVYTTYAGIVSWMMAFTCIANPKMCFGSCPTVYTYQHGERMLTTELFSYAISPSLIAPDLDRLGEFTDTIVSLSITNEALETHYIDQLDFQYVDHAHGTQAFTSNQQIKLVSRPRSLDICTDGDGNSIADIMQEADTLFWRSGPEYLAAQAPEAPFDTIRARIACEGADSVRIVVRWRNTLLSTTLLYEIMLADQGMQALQWQRMLDADPIYSTMFKALYQNFSGLTIETRSAEPGAESHAEHLVDAGPLVWRTDVVDVPTYGQDTVDVEFTALADNVMIDHIAYDVDPPPAPVLHSVSRHEPSALDVRRVHEPGDSLEITLHLPNTDQQRTLFVRSSGYYYEWVRGGWLSNASEPITPDLLDPETLIARLADRWMVSHIALEREFFQTRVPLGR